MSVSRHVARRGGIFLVCLALLGAAVGLAAQTPTHHTTLVAVSATTTSTVTHPVTPVAPSTKAWAPLAQAIAQRAQDEKVVFLTLAYATTTTTTTTTSPPITNGSPPTQVSASASSAGEGVPCDGDLPPCWRVQIESHGTWNAYNPTGCSGTGCYGPYQFGGFWAGKLGLPSDLTTATHEQWVTAARILWDNGAGCSNWDAC